MCQHLGRVTGQISSQIRLDFYVFFFLFLIEPSLTCMLFDRRNDTAYPQQRLRIYHLSKANDMKLPFEGHEKKSIDRKEMCLVIVYMKVQNLLDFVSQKFTILLNPFLFFFF